MTGEDRPRGVSISPRAMTDSVADWPLHRVVEHLKKKEHDDKDYCQDCRVYSRSSIRFLNPILGELASEFDVSVGKITRFLSYHGLSIFREDATVSSLRVSYGLLRRRSLQSNDPDMAAIIDSPIPYSPADICDDRASYRVYLWVHSDVEEMSQICGMFIGRVVQLAIVRSVLTCDLPILESVRERLSTESDRWDRWMKYRLGQMDMAVAIWGTV